MRWSNLSLAAEQQHRLPGYRDEAVVRRFDAPEALDIRFYEVRARSALNRVPGASRMPFRWTINPYRGCTHACVYCLWGGTRILLANGRSLPLAHLQIGDEILGTTGGGTREAGEGDDAASARAGSSDTPAGGGSGEPGSGARTLATGPPRLVPTRVLAKWSTLKPAYRIVLATGAELLASGDHRFLTTDGWCHVSPGDLGVAPRPALQPGSRLVGLGEESPPAVEGTPVTAGEGLRVTAVQPLRMALRMYDLTTGTGNFVAGGVVSHNCFARPTHRYLDFGPGRDFEREIVVKVNVPELLRAELARPSWRGEHVALGTNTDPYQWVEGRYKLMEGVWEAMRDAHGGTGNPGSVLTKSPLLLRDLSLMRELAARTDFSACLSIPTLDERAWRATEPHTPHPRARLEAVAELNRAGIPTGVLIAPLMPGINDDPRQLEPLVQGALDAGATSVGAATLHLRRDVKDVFMAWLGEQRPELMTRYEQLYARGAYAPREERARLADRVRAARGGRAAGPGRFARRGRFGGQRAGPGTTGIAGASAAPRAAADEQAGRQERLF